MIYFEELSGGVCFPAVSPYDVGDKISILSCKDETQKLL